MAAAAVILILLGTNSYYILDEENYAVVSTLGSAQAVSQAGLHFKIPFIQNVRRYPRALRECRLAMTLRPERVMNLNLS